MTATGTSGLARATLPRSLVLGRAASALLAVLVGVTFTLATPLSAVARTDTSAAASKHKAKKTAKKTKKSTHKKSAAAVPTVHLSPHIRVEPLGPVGIAPVPYSAVSPFLTRSQIIPSDSLAAAPRIVALPENRTLVSQGDSVYARGGELQGAALGSRFQLYREAKAIKDPLSSEVLGYEVQAVGQAELVSAGHENNPQLAIDEVPYTLRIVRAIDAIQIGDRLAPLPAYPLTGVAVKNFNPHTPDAGISGVVAAVPERAEAAKDQLVIVNKGGRDGVKLGDVFTVRTQDRVATDPTSPGQVTLAVPGSPKAKLMLVHVFDKASYALVMDSRWPVKAGDSIAPFADADASH